MARLTDQARRDNGLAIADLLGNRGRSGLSLTLLALSAAAMVPLPGPFGLVFGSCLMMVAVQMLVGRQRLALPGFIGRRRLPLPVVEAIMATSQPWIARFETRMRAGRLKCLTGGLARFGLSWLVLAMAFLIALPIPFGNTLPALAVILIALALANRDGLVVLSALAMTAVAGAASYGLLLVAGSLLGFGA